MNSLQQACPLIYPYTPADLISGFAVVIDGAWELNALCQQVLYLTVARGGGQCCRSQLRQGCLLDSRC